MRQARLLAPTRVGRAHGPAAHDGTITTEAPDQMWGMDATSCLTRQEGPATVFVVVDHCARECIGVHAAKPGTRFEAVEPLRQGVQAIFGAYTAGIARGLHARHDHGSQYVSDYFQDELRFLGITASPAFVREPEGNGVAERFIRTLKEQLLWVRPFDAVEEYEWRCWTSRIATIARGSVSGTGIRHLRRCGREPRARKPPERAAS
jgi:putative transposase